MRARIVGAFTAFGVVLGIAFAVMAWLIARNAGDSNLEALVAGGAVAIAVLGLLVGRYTARRVLAPVEELGEIVDTSRPEQLADALASRTYDREIGALALRLEEAMRRLQGYVHREQRFTRYASHELRSPVAVIKGAVELLRAFPETEADKLQRPLERIERSVADMESILAAFVWLGRERSELLRAETTDVADAVRDTVSRYRYLVDAKPVSVEIHTAANPTVQAPSAVLDLIVGNLVANAFHYTEQGKVVVDIEPHSLSVTDTGPGIPLDQLDSAGESFVKGNRSVGYGIGLAIARSLSERFGWRLWFESQPGEGTVARLYF